MTAGGMNKVAKQGGQNTCDVDVLTVDELVKQSNLSPIIAKIDVEGYEHPLLTGAEQLISTTLQAIIIELNESGREYGYSDALVHSLIVSRGFAPYRYDPKTRELSERGEMNHDALNTIYIKRSAVGAVRERVMLAAPVDLRIGQI